MLARHSCRGGRGRRSLSRRGLSGPTTRLTTLRARSRIRTILTSTGSGWRVTWRWAEIGGWQHEDLLEQLARDAGPAIGLGRDVPAHGNDVGVRLAAGDSAMRVWPGVVVRDYETTGLDPFEVCVDRMSTRINSLNYCETRMQFSA